MGEYLITVKGKTPSLFERDIEASDVYIAKTAKEAVDTALKEVREGLKREGITKDDITIILKDVKKL